MRTMCKTALGFGVFTGFLLSDLSCAHAMNGQTPIEIDGGPLGPLSLSLAAPMALAII